MTKTLTIAEAMRRIEQLEARIAHLEQNTSVTIHHWHHNTRVNPVYPMQPYQPVWCGGDSTDGKPGF